MEDYEGGEEIRLMRVAWADVGDVLDIDPSEAEREWVERDHILLNLLRDTAEGWERDYPGLGESCIRQLQPETDAVGGTGPCYLFSPRNAPPQPEVIPYTSIGSHRHLIQDEESIPEGWKPDAGNFYHSIAVPLRVSKGSEIGFTTRWSQAMGNISHQLVGEMFVEAEGTRNGEGDQTGNWLLSVGSDIRMLGCPLRQ